MPTLKYVIGGHTGMLFCVHRFGKPLVLDMMEVNMFETIAMRFDDVQKGFMDTIMDKSFIEQRL